MWQRQYRLPFLGITCSSSSSNNANSTAGNALT
jgi:hypothetical protein